MSIILPKDLETFENCVTELDNLIKRIQNYQPEVQLYCSNNELNLMIGPTHDENGQLQLDNVVSKGTIESLHGGYGEGAYTDEETVL